MAAKMTMEERLRNEFKRALNEQVVRNCGQGEFMVPRVLKAFDIAQARLVVYKLQQEDH